MGLKYGYSKLGNYDSAMDGILIIWDLQLGTEQEKNAAQWK